MKTKDFVESLIAAKDWVNQYPGVFYVDNVLLFCSMCNVVVDHVAPWIVLFMHKKKMNSSQQNNGCIIYNEHRIIDKIIS